MGLAGRGLGALAADHQADIVLLEADPTQDIRNARKVAQVWRDGKLVVERQGTAHA
jgi:imidazolonepropionase-like amidohydrolase